ncbi:MAG: hypothetical protein IJ751_06715 [Oscillospiraceae bacterium]|nr:hypothetical protein [Oscillospiraceae bacterium]
MEDRVETQTTSLPVNLEPDYLINTQTDPDGLIACGKELVNPVFMVLYLALGIFFVLLGAVLYMLHLSFEAWMAWLVGGVALFLRANSPKRLAGMQAERFASRYQTEVIGQQMVFWPQGVAVVNRISLSQQNIRYEEITKLARHGDYLYFTDREDHWSILRLEDTVGLTGFLPYLRAKCSRAKQTGFKKK